MSAQPTWQLRDSLDRVEDALTKAGSRVKTLSDGSLIASCVAPGHDDRNPSLHASWRETEFGGRVVLYCPACGHGVTQEDWAGYLGLDYDALFDDLRWSLHNRNDNRASFAERQTAKTHGKLGPLPKRIAAQLDELLERAPTENTGEQNADEEEHEHHFVVVTTYTYADADGRELQRVKRMRCDSCGEKTFWQSYRSGASWVRKQPADYQPLLYRYPQILEAIAGGEHVWIVEGEKDADAGAAIGLATTTNSSGGANFPAELAPTFKGATVNVVLDRDATGWDRGVRLHDVLLEAGAAQVFLLLPAVTSRKADLSDHLEAGHGVDELIDVPIDALRARAGLRELERQVKLLQRNELEAQAQLQVAQHDASRCRDAKAAERRRFAKRWAKESLRIITRCESVRAQIKTHAAQASDNDFAAESLEIASTMVASARRVAVEIYRAAGEQLPVALDDSARVARAAANSGAAQRSATAVITGAATGTDGVSAGVSQPLTVLPGGGEGGGGGGGYLRPVVEIDKTEYAIIDGEIVEMRKKPMGRGEDARTELRPQRVINTVVRIHAKEIKESAAEVERASLHLGQLIGREDREESAHRIHDKADIVAVIVEHISKDGTSRLIRIPFDDYGEGKWLEHLPVQGLDYGKGRAGRERVLAAMNQISTDWQIRTAHTTTGWRRREDGTWVYLTADGAIGTDGHEPIATHLTGPLARYNWPTPSQNAQKLREAFLSDSAGLMEHFPDRVIGALLGSAYRSVIGPMEASICLQAPPGVGKTGLAALVMHHYGEMWDRNTPLSSMSGQGATTNALRQLLAMAKDTLCLLDDVAPDYGRDAALNRLSATARLIANGESRPRSSRDGQQISESAPPRTTGLFTSELIPRTGSSGARRLLFVPVSRYDVRLDDILRFDTAESKHGRALLLSSFIQWLAGRYDQVSADVEDYKRALRSEILAGHRRPSQLLEQNATKAGDLWAGWNLMLEFLTECGALGEDECKQWLQRVRGAMDMIVDAAEETDVAVTTGRRTADMIRHSLMSGASYVVDLQTGAVPSELASRLGWSKRDTGGSFSGEWAREPRAIALGYADLRPVRRGVGRELVCPPEAFEAVLKDAISGMIDTTSVDLSTAQRALEDEGILKVELQRKGDGIIARRTIHRSVTCVPHHSDPAKPWRRRFMVLDLDALLGDVDDDEETPGNDENGGGADDTPPAPPTAPTPTTSAPETTAAQLAITTDAAALEQEAPMSTHTNTGGLSLTPVHAETATPCVVCAAPSGMSFAGHSMHVPCFWHTAAATIDELARELRPSVAPTPVPTTPKAAPATAPEPSAASTAVNPAPAAAVAAPTLAGDDPIHPIAIKEGVFGRSNPFRAGVAVIDVDAVWLPDGTRLELSYTPQHLGELEELTRSVQLGTVGTKFWTKAPAGMHWRSETMPGLVIPTAALWEAMGLDLDTFPAYPSERPAWWETTSSLDLVTKASEAGCVFGDGERTPMLGGITRLRSPQHESTTTNVLLLANLDAEWGLMDLSPVQVAQVFQILINALGMQWRGSAISTFSDILSAVATRQVREALKDKPVDFSGIGPATANDLEGHFNFTRTPLEDEREGWLALFDRGGSYAAGWSSMLCGLGAPEHVENDVTFDAKRAGWWKIRLPQRSEGAGTPMPDLLDPQGKRAGQDVWTTTPVLEYAVTNLDVTPEILEAWIWPPERSVRALAAPGKVIAGALDYARTIDSDASRVAQAMIKMLYKQVSGWFMSPKSAQQGGRLALHQPYWAHAMRGRARVGIIHQVKKIGEETGRWPLVVAETDVIGYAAPASVAHDDAVGAWPGEASKLGKKWGQYKLAHWAPMNSVAAHLDGGGWNGTSALCNIGEGEDA